MRQHQRKKLKKRSNNISTPQQYHEDNSTTTSKSIKRKNNVLHSRRRKESPKKTVLMVTTTTTTTTTKKTSSAASSSSTTMLKYEKELKKNVNDSVRSLEDTLNRVTKQRKKLVRTANSNLKQHRLLVQETTQKTTTTTTTNNNKNNKKTPTKITNTSKTSRPPFSSSTKKVTITDNNNNIRGTPGNKGKIGKFKRLKSNNNSHTTNSSKRIKSPSSSSSFGGSPRNEYKEDKVDFDFMDDNDLDEETRILAGGKAKNRNRFARLVKKHSNVARIQKFKSQTTTRLMTQQQQQEGGNERTSSSSQSNSVQHQPQHEQVDNHHHDHLPHNNNNDGQSSKASLVHKDQNQPNITSTTTHSSQTKFISKEEKEKHYQELGKKRGARMVDTQKRRSIIERQRIRRFQQNSGTKRQQRIKKRSADEKLKVDLIKQWLFSVALGSRIGLSLQYLRDFRAIQHRVFLEHTSAIIITRQMRLFRFRAYRKRIRSAFYILGSILVMKVRTWKKTRRRMASDKIRAFLLELEKENRNSGGCLALIVKGKKWRAYRQKIVVLQRLWREKLRIMSAQVLILDQQWIREQDRRTEEEMERIYLKGEALAMAENEENEVKNRTRRLIKLKSLPKKRWESRTAIMSKMLKGADLLSEGNICPREIRHGIIKDMLKHMRKMFLHELELYIKQVEKYEEEVKSYQRRRALLIGFSGNGVATAFTNGYLNSSSMRKEGIDSSICPKKPRFRIVLRERALNQLIESGGKYVDELRYAWKPENMELELIEYDGRQAAKFQYEVDSG